MVLYVDDIFYLLVINIGVLHDTKQFLSKYFQMSDQFAITNFKVKNINYR